MNIRAKLSLTYLTVSLLALTFISTFFYLYFKKSLTADVFSHLESVSSIQSNRIKGIIEQNLERIRLVSSRTQLRISLKKYLATKNKEHLKKISLIINDAMNSINSFTTISVLDNDGNVITSTNPDRLNKNYSGYDFFPIAQVKNDAQHFFLDDDKALNLYLSGPLNIDNTAIGILLIESDTRNIVTLLNDYSGLGKTGETVLGRRSPKGDFVEYLAPLRFDSEAALRRNEEFFNSTNPMVIALSKKQQFLTTAKDYRGHEVLAFTNYINDTNWGLVVKIDKAEAFDPIYALANYSLIIVLSVMIIIAWVSFMFSRMMSKPIVDLTNTASSIEQGDLSLRAEVTSNDEISKLARTFNRMTNGLVTTQRELKNSNKELQDHRDNLEAMVSMRTQELMEKNKELETFSYSVSHDLRSPLRTIDGFSSILLDDYSDLIDENGKNSLNRIRQACQRMGSLIDDLLDLSRVNLNEIEKNEINLSHKVNMAFERIEKNQKTRQLEFMIQPEVYAYADDTLMDVVVSNLISNAWKYSEKSEITRIEFGETSKNGEPVYFVKDNGVGFDMKYENKLFKAFQRLVTNDEYPGNGIGLATVSRIVTRHGGRIWAESEPDKGATFYFTIPAN